MKFLKIIFPILFLSAYLHAHSQDKKFKIHTLAFYNLENLFDTINDPTKFDEYSPIMELKTNRLVSGKLEGDDIHIIVNHWPSRRGGEARSRPKRMAAAKLNKHLIDSLQTRDPYAKVFIMGDLNDDPLNPSVKTVLKAKRKQKKVGFKGLYNPFENFYRDGLGTTAYRDNWSLFDQIIISKPLLEKDYTTFRYYKAGIFNKNYLITSKGRYKGYPFRSWSDGGFSNGFSDHFPVYMYVIRAVE